MAYFYDRAAPITEAQQALVDEANRAFGVDHLYAVAFAEAHHRSEDRPNLKRDRKRARQAIQATKHAV